MDKIVETREYVDGGRTLRADVLDNGCVLLSARQNDEDPKAWRASAAVSSTVLRQLADLADAAMNK